MPRALITGITGQDGSYLAEFLLKKGYEVHGTFRRLSSPNFWRLQYLGISGKVRLIPSEMTDMSSISEAIELSKPDEIYHLAAQSFVGASFEQPIGAGEVTGLAVTRILESVRQFSPRTKVYQASSSEIYGNSKPNLKTELTPFEPRSPYAIAKLYGFWMAKTYREAYGLYVANGLLFNHESPLRGLEFVTRKISNAVARISLGLQTEIALGNLNSKRDWGYAPEYVDSMWLMLQQKKPDDYVIATGESHSVEEFAKLGFDSAGLNWKNHVVVDRTLVRPLDIEELNGDYTKAKKKLGWSPRIKFGRLVSIMVKEDVSRWKKWLAGERFAWDAPNYPENLRIETNRRRLDV